MENPSTYNEFRNTVRTISIGTLWRILRYPFVALSFFIIPRMMGNVVYGQYAFFMSIYLILDVMTDVGITQTCGRFIPELEHSGEDRISSFLHSMLFYGVLITLAMIAAVLGGNALYCWKQINFDSAWWLILCFLLLTSKIQGILFAFIYGRNEIGRYSFKEFIRSAVTFILVIVLFHFFGFIGALWALVLNQAVLLITAGYWTRHYLFRSVKQMRFSEFKPYLVFGLMFYVPMLLFTLIQRSGNIFIKMLAGSSEEVAYYDVANQFLLLTSTFLGLIISTLLPSLTSLYVKNQHEIIQQRQRTVITYCGVIVFLTFSALVTMGRHVLGLLGPSFVPVYKNAMIIAVSMPAILIAYVGMNISILEKRPSVYIFGVVTGMVVMAVACVYMVPTMGSIGASWATVMGYSSLAIVLCINYRKQLAGILKRFGVLLAVALCIVPACFYEFNIAVSIIIFLVISTVYTAVLLRLKIIKLSDARKICQAIWQPVDK